MDHAAGQTLPDVETLELQPIAPELPPPRRSALERLWLSLKENRHYLYLVVCPAIVAACYYGFLAADRYETEARFVVRSPSMAATNQLASLMQGQSAIVRSTDEAYIVHAYLESRDAVRQLAATMDLEKVIARSGGDVLWWYPGLLRRRTGERLWRHFQRFLTIEFDSSTGITTIRVLAFAPEDAQTLARTLLSNAEALINRLSERAKQEALQTAQGEVERSRQLARAVVEKMTEFRRRHSLIDPGRASASALRTITELAVLVARTNAELSELQRGSPNSPQAAVLRLRIAALDEQIKKERTALAGADTSLAPLIADYEGLLLEREFAEKAFASAQAALDIARVETERQRLFLEQISTPSLPDYAAYPYRLLNSLLCFMALHFLFIIGHRLAVDAKSHAGN